MTEEKQPENKQPNPLQEALEGLFRHFGAPKPQGEGAAAPAPQVEEKEPVPQGLFVPGLGQLIIQPGGPRPGKDLKGKHKEVVELVREHVYEGNQKDAYKAGVILDGLRKLEGKFTYEELNGRVQEIHDRAEEEYDAKHSDVARALKKQASGLIAKYDKRMEAAKDKEAEMMLIRSEFYELNKELAGQQVVTNNMLLIESVLYPVHRGHRDKIPNVAVDAVMDDVMNLRRAGYFKEADQYEIELREHKAVPTAEDAVRLQMLRNPMRIMKGEPAQPLNVRLENSDGLESLGVMPAPEAFGAPAVPRKAGVLTVA